MFRSIALKLTSRLKADNPSLAGPELLSKLTGSPITLKFHPMEPVREIRPVPRFFMNYAARISEVSGFAVGANLVFVRFSGV